MYWKRLKVMDRTIVPDTFKIPKFAMEYIQQTFFLKYAAKIPLKTIRRPNKNFMLFFSQNRFLSTLIAVINYHNCICII